MIRQTLENLTLDELKPPVSTVSSRPVELTEQKIRDILTAINTRQGGLGQIALAHGVSMSMVCEVRTTRDTIIAERERPEPLDPVDPIGPGEIGGRDG